ncbi:hypothetical protein B0H13DRAFT_2368681 [Mycena leptocephala]|nr:hypothetical protein B0H13DRAFT_2368681 [Mycena leptocephala]
MDSIEIPSQMVRPPVASLGNPQRMFSPSPLHRLSGSRTSPPRLLQAACSSPTVAASPALSLLTSVFGKPGLLLGAKPNKMSEGIVANSELLEEGELDTEGEIVVGTSMGHRLPTDPIFHFIYFIPSNTPNSSVVAGSSRSAKIRLFAIIYIVALCFHVCLYALLSRAKM